MANKVLKTSQSRVFLQEGQGGPINAPSYQSCFKMTGLSQGFGDIERIECPDPYNYGKFVEVAQIRGATERVTTSLQGRYYMDLLSTMLRLAKRGCPFDVQLHLGTSTDPSDFDSFTKSVVLEGAMVTSFSTEDLGALESGDEAVVNETIEISAANVYEIRPLSFAEIAGSVVTTELVDVAIVDTASCGDEETASSDGCNVVWALSINAGGSPSTPADVIKISGSTTVARDIDTLGATKAPSGMDGLGNYVVVVSNADAAYHYALKSQFTATTVPTWTRVAMTHNPNNIFSLGNVAFIAADWGALYKLTSPSGTIVTLCDSSLTTSDLKDVHALDANYILTVGDTGTVLKSVDGVTFTKVAFPNLKDLTCCWMSSKTRWWVGTADGFLYYTENSGTDWASKSFSGSGAGAVYDIDFSTEAVGYLAHTTAGNVGRILRTYNGGYSWLVMPEGTGTMPSNQKIERVAVCADSPNLVYGAGLGVATDGILIKGTAS